jgi:hypothetical protein
MCPQCHDGTTPAGLGRAAADPVAYAARRAGAAGPLRRLPTANRISRRTRPDRRQPCPFDQPRLPDPAWRAVAWRGGPSARLATLIQRRPAEHLADAGTGDHSGAPFSGELSRFGRNISECCPVGQCRELGNSAPERKALNLRRKMRHSTVTCGQYIRCSGEIVVYIKNIRCSCRGM